jgi:hypothetical protein
MRRRSIIGVTAAVLALGVATAWPGAAAAAGFRAKGAIEGFQARVADYARTRELVRASVGGARDADPVVVRRRLREGLRAVRADARLGDVFTPDVAGAFRARIWHTLTGRDLETLVNRHSSAAPAEALDVNARCRSAETGELPPVLLAVLPRLPAGLEYRLSGADLVLLDAEAELVVDLIVDALVPLVYV